jgi:hypothetical protein
MRLKVGIGLLAAVLLATTVGCTGNPKPPAPTAPPTYLVGPGNFGSLFYPTVADAVPVELHTDADAAWDGQLVGNRYSGTVSGTGAYGNDYEYHFDFDISGHEITRFRMGSPEEGGDGELIDENVSATRVPANPLCSGGVGLLLEGGGPVLSFGVPMGHTWDYDLTICQPALANWFGSTP